MEKYQHIRSAIPGEGILRVYGPYVHTRKNLRYFVWIVYDNGRTRSTTVARFLMEQKLGRRLRKDETVDHIDDNPSNDAMENLQILSLADNIRKCAEKHRPIQWFDFQCPQCGSWSRKEARTVRHNRKLSKAGPFCGRRCAGQWSAHRQYHSPS